MPNLGWGAGMQIAERTVDTEWPETLPVPLERFLAYWQGLRQQAGRLPRRREIDPLEIPRGLLPGIGIFDWLPQTGGAIRIRYRLLGDNHTRAIQRNLSGCYFDDVHAPDTIAALLAEYAGILASGEPAYVRRATPLPNHEFAVFQRIIAPLLDDQDQPRHLIGYWLWENLDNEPRYRSAI
jgi:hypothetical protein